MANYIYNFDHRRNIICTQGVIKLSEEMPFKSMKITLSEEAIERLDSITKGASFRSNSSTIEECIRVVYDIIHELYSVVGTPDEEVKPTTRNAESSGFERIAMRMSRFTGRVLCRPPDDEDDEEIEEE